MSDSSDLVFVFFHSNIDNQNLFSLCPLNFIKVDVRAMVPSVTGIWKPNTILQLFTPNQLV